MRLISLLLKRELIISSIRYFISCLYEFEFLNEVCTSDYPFLFLFLQQVSVASIELIPRHSFSRLLTSQDGRLWNCVRQGSIVLTDIPYTTAPLMDLLSVEAMTLILSTTRHPVAVPLPTLASLTAHQAGTTMEAPSPRHFWQEDIMIILHQTKWKHFTKQPNKLLYRIQLQLGSQLFLSFKHFSSSDLQNIHLLRFFFHIELSSQICNIKPTLFCIFRFMFYRVFLITIDYIWEAVTIGKSLHERKARRGGERNWMSSRRVSPFSRELIFMRAHVSLALLSLRGKWWLLVG